MLANGFISGCLTVISNDFQSNFQSILQEVTPLATQEWNKFDQWASQRYSPKDRLAKFTAYYKLDEFEKQLFYDKSAMPDSFIEKYYTIQLTKAPWYLVRRLSGFLFHKKNPNTFKNLAGGLMEHKIYKVRCNICNRIFFMDEKSINCVKWRSCIGASCLSYTVSDDVDSYTNLCAINNESDALQKINAQLSKTEDISDPLSYYGGYEDLHISYISDVHLLHHLKSDMPLKILIRNTVKSLCATMDMSGIIIFAGDISSDATTTIAFYTEFVKYIERHFRGEKRQIFAVLGNHEYVGFDSVNDAVEYYRPIFAKLGIKLLHNSFCEFDFYDKTGIIFGGTGFAKYNLTYNADTLLCCNNFTRANEFKETSLFEKAYLEAKNCAKDKACFVCVSHYPIHDCSTAIDSDTIYFYGHNHQNFYCKNENAVIYADNQIGYKNPNIKFKTMKTGVELNPYFALKDGLYKTTIKDYLQFNRYIGEFIGDGSLLYHRCQYGNANLYVIKRKGYYGFFIMNPNVGVSQGISIVNGGKTKKITKSTDLQWLFDNFEVVLYKYLKALTPLRLVQEQISNELKDLGFSGTIHGCIIDIDFYHHIMLNPMDGTMTYYFSSAFGFVQPLSSFSQVIASLQKNSSGFFTSGIDYKLIEQRFNVKKLEPNYLLGKVNESHFLESSNFNAISELEMGEQVVSHSEGMYGLSRKINPLQRLFSCHTLRDFDLSLAETEPTFLLE